MEIKMVNNLFKFKSIQTTYSFSIYFIVVVPTYILGPNKNDTGPNYQNLKDGEICSNITFLGKCIKYTKTNLKQT